MKKLTRRIVCPITVLPILVEHPTSYFFRNGNVITYSLESHWTNPDKVLQILRKGKQQSTSHSKPDNEPPNLSINSAISLRSYHTLIQWSKLLVRGDAALLTVHHWHHGDKGEEINLKWNIQIETMYESVASKLALVINGQTKAENISLQNTLQGEDWSMWCAG